MEYLPDVYQHFERAFPRVHLAHQEPAKACYEGSPLDERARLVKLGIAEVLSDAGSGTRLHRHGIKDEYSLIGPPTHLYRHYRLDAEGIELEALGVVDAAPRPR